ncbi:hypothetical protein C8Q78DRAFT_830456 [Trametes maxima]|nr:hypothetical protein C8Q78DRAFT_830456 [Trametes maxima]
MDRTDNLLMAPELYTRSTPPSVSNTPQQPTISVDSGRKRPNTTEVPSMPDAKRVCLSDSTDREEHDHDWGASKRGPTSSIPLLPQATVLETASTVTPPPKPYKQNAVRERDTLPSAVQPSSGQLRQGRQRKSKLLTNPNIQLGSATRRSARIAGIFATALDR